MAVAAPVRARARRVADPGVPLASEVASKPLPEVVAIVDALVAGPNRAHDFIVSGRGRGHRAHLCTALEWDARRRLADLRTPSVNAVLLRCHGLRPPSARAQLVPALRFHQVRPEVVGAPLILLG